MFSIKYPILFLFELCFCQTGCEVDEKHQNQQHCADAPGGGEVAVLEGPQIEQDGEGRAVGCVSLGDAACNDFRRTGGEEQGRALTHDTAHGQDAAGDDAVDAAGQHDGADDVPLARAEAQSALPVALRHRFEGLLRGTDDGGQVHDHQRQAAGEQAGLKAHCLGEDQHTHEAVDDAGDARKRLIRELDDLNELPVGGVLREVNCRAHAQRKDDEQGEQDDI